MSVLLPISFLTRAYIYCCNNFSRKSWTDTIKSFAFSPFKATKGTKTHQELESFKFDFDTAPQTQNINSDENVLLSLVS